MRWIYVVILAIAAHAAADTVQTPKSELDKQLALGIDAFRLGKYAEARTHLERARAIDRKSGEAHRYLAAVAQAESKWVECIASAREALIVEPAAKAVPDTRKLHEACRVSAGRMAYVGTLGDTAALSVTANAPSATVKVRGLVFGGTPIPPRTVAPGRVAIDVEKAGYIGAKLDVDVVPGIVTDVEVKLEVGEDTTGVPVARKSGWITLPADLIFDTIVIDGVAAKVPADRKFELAPGMHVIEIRAPHRDPWRRQVAITADNITAVQPMLVDSAPRARRGRLGTILATSGGMLFAVGVFSFYTSKDAAEEARRIAAAEIARPVGDTTPPIRTRADFEDARSRANRWALLSTMAYTAGIAAAGVGAYFILKGRAPPPDEVPGIVIAPVEGGAMIARSVSW